MFSKLNKRELKNIVGGDLILELGGRGDGFIIQLNDDVSTVPPPNWTFTGLLVSSPGVTIGTYVYPVAIDPRV
jgi:bacteriocin-like protein